MLKLWWGPKHFTAPVVKIDFRVGGKYLLCMEGTVPNMGKIKAWSTGTYKEIIPMKKIVVTDSFSDEKGNIVSATAYGMEGFLLEMEVIIVFQEAARGKTKMTLKYPSVGNINQLTFSNMYQGWNQSFDKLEESLVKFIHSHRLLLQ
jgi:uncharacterized protein YndB with AHSA1/START domain